jgi:PAS domain S-box-containing protein
MAAIVQWSVDAIMSKDLHGIITTWNKGAEGLFGYTAREVLGKPITLLIPWDRWHEEPVILDHIRRGEPIIDFETVRRRKDGSLVDISLCVSPVKDADGNIIGASKIARDITKRKRTEQALKDAHEELHRHAQELEQTVATRTAELRQTVAELEAFSYSLSHDLRAPLRTIHSFVELVLQQHGQQIGAQGTEFLRTSLNSAQRLDRLVESVLAYTRSSRQQLNFGTVDVDLLVREIISERLELQAPRAEVTLQSPLLPVCGDEASLTQCLTNLLGNGVKYVAPGVQPRLRVSSEQRGEFVRLWIEDNGIGVAPADQEHLFEMFRRGRSSCEYEGSGLGLAIVRKAVERMGGQVGVESEPGRGSRFWLELPKAV